MDTAQDLALHKIVVFGGFGVGKSSLTLRLIHGEFIPEIDSTIEDTYRQQILVDGQACLLDILDTVEHEEAIEWMGPYIQAGEAFLLVFSLTSRRSFGVLQYYHKRIMREKGRPVPIILAGNKCDIQSGSWEVTSADAAALAQTLGCSFIETSAKDNVNVEKLFQELVREYRRMGVRIVQAAPPPEPS